MKAKRRDMQIIFQDSVGSLDPRMRIRNLVGEGLAIHGVPRAERADRVVDVLERVGLGADTLNRYPHQFSGGQRQRIGIARALVLQPKLVVADEPVSALDVSIQSQVLNLLVELKQAFGLTYLFVAHDLAVVGYIADRIAVMYLGKIVEFAPAAELFARPLHPYTVALLSAIPVPRPGMKKRRIVLSGDVPSPMNPPSGCRFRTRCPIAQPICAEVEPPLEPNGEGHLVACHFAGHADPGAGPARRMAGNSRDVRLLHDQRVPTRDGITLSADVYLPLSGGPLPTIVQWTPYESTRERFIALGRLVRAARLRRGRRRLPRPLRVGRRVHRVGEGRRRRARHADLGGRAAVVQRPHRHVGPQLRRARAVAARAPRPPEPPVHRAAGDPRRLLLGRLLHGRRVPARAHARRGRALDERDGPDHRPERGRPRAERPRPPHLPLIELDEVTIGRKVDYWRLWWEHQENDEYWHQFKHRPEKVTVPIFQQGGWFDPYSGSHLRSFAAIGDRVPNRVMIGPWSHEEEVETFRGDVDLSAALTVIRDHELVFYDRYLKDEGNDWEERPPAELFVLGENVWHGETSGRSRAPSTRRGTCARAASSTRSRRAATSRPTATTTTRPTRCRRSAASTRC